ncbi:hypothetical protein L7F22_034735 [Adiantum nelumboides]|nr:hypothetical protein [Adiantum nelumboides]
MSTVQQHALVFPFPLQGHIAPLLQLSQHLAASYGFLITFINTEVNHASSLRALSKLQLAASADACARINMLALSDGLPFDAERKPSNLSKLVHSMLQHMTPLLECVISERSQTSSPVTCVIADLFLPWMHDLAKHTGIPAFIGFHASSIAQFSSLFHIPLLVSMGQLNLDGRKLIILCMLLCSV